MTDTYCATRTGRHLIGTHRIARYGTEEHDATVPDIHRLRAVRAEAETVGHLARGAMVHAPTESTAMNFQPDEDESWHPGAIDATGDATPLSNVWRRTKAGRWTLGDVERDWIRIAHHGPYAADKRFGAVLPIPSDTSSPLARTLEPSRRVWVLWPTLAGPVSIPLTARGVLHRTSATATAWQASAQFTVSPDRRSVPTPLVVCWDAVPVPQRAAASSAARADRRATAAQRAAEWAIAVHGPDPAALEAAYRAVKPTGRKPAWLVLAMGSGDAVTAPTGAPTAEVLARDNTPG